MHNNYRKYKKKDGKLFKLGHNIIILTFWYTINITTSIFKFNLIEINFIFN